MPRGRTLVALVVAAIVVVYGVVVALYAIDFQTRAIAGCVDEPPADAVQLSVTPTGVDAGADRMPVTFAFRSFGPAASRDGALEVPLTVVIGGTDGPATFEYEPGAVPAPISVSFVTTGAVESWPFDTHVAELAIAVVDDTGPDGPVVYDVDLCGSAHVPGWTFTDATVTGDEGFTIDGQALDRVQLIAHRSGATVAFGLVILALMVVMPVLCLTVAIRVLRGQRKAEATLMSWMAAMLFATIPLRSFLPGSPPVGSWVDYLVVLWVIAGLVAALVVYVVAWLKWAPPGGPSPR